MSICMQGGRDSYKIDNIKRLFEKHHDLTPSTLATKWVKCEGGTFYALGMRFEFTFGDRIGDVYAIQPYINRAGFCYWDYVYPSLNIETFKQMRDDNTLQQYVDKCKAIQEAITGIINMKKDIKDREK